MEGGIRNFTYDFMGEKEITKFRKDKSSKFSDDSRNIENIGLALRANLTEPTRGIISKVYTNNIKNIAQVHSDVCEDVKFNDAINLLEQKYSTMKEYKPCLVMLQTKQYRYIEVDIS